MSIELNDTERAIITKASRAGGGLHDATPAMLTKFAAVAHEQTEASRPVIVKQSRVDAATKAARGVQIERERTERLNKIVASQTASRGLKRQARYALEMMSKSEAEQQAEVQRILDELTAGVEEMRAYRVMRDTASGPTAPIVRKAAQTAMNKLMSDHLTEIQNREKGI